jgi:hypothetical protein
VPAGHQRKNSVRTAEKLYAQRRKIICGQKKNFVRIKEKFLAQKKKIVSAQRKNAIRISVNRKRAGHTEKPSENRGKVLRNFPSLVKRRRSLKEVKFATRKRSVQASSVKLLHKFHAEKSFFAFFFLVSPSFTILRSNSPSLHKRWRKET